MNGVYFDGKHCHREYGYLLKSYTIGDASPRIDRVQIPGKSGSLDYSEFFGYPVFDDRPVDIQLKIIAKYPEQSTRYSALQNAVNGRVVKVVFEDDPSWYWLGRARVGKLVHDRNGRCGYTSVSVLCHPYKKRVAETISTTSIGASYKQIEIVNDAEMVVPDVHCTVETDILYNGASYTVPPGDSLLPDLQFQSGKNTLQAKTKGGSGSITIRYRGGSL